MNKDIFNKVAGKFRRNILKPLKTVPRLVRNYIRVDLLGQIFPLKPSTLNFLANDICNSRCQMCLIWKKKISKELTPQDLRKILSDGLFSHLKYVGVSGGEPTLRKDLPELFDAICGKKPKIKGVGMITNAILESSVKEKVMQSYEVCRRHGVPFNVMISLDGIGDVHDVVRGCKGNFQSAYALLKYFHKEKAIPTSFGCTITKSNVQFIDEFLDFSKREGLYGRFRVAEFIDRLYNEDQKEFIRSFSDLEKYHLGLFFFRVEHEFERNSTFRKTYRNIRRMIAEGKPRANRCPYQSEAVVLTSSGELLYCSPKSPSLGDVLKESAKKLYFSKMDIRKEVIKTACDFCIHDYHVDVTLPERMHQVSEKIRIFLCYDCRGLVKRSRSISKQKRVISDLWDLKSREVMIIGWYGTETVGDKAILWTIVHNLMSRSNPPERIYLSSLHPFISQWTIREMGFPQVTVVETFSKEFEQICNRVDEVVVGGGPLMDTELLNHILFAFMKASRRKAISRIEGCGIGPLKSPLYIKVVKEILRLADHITLRDAFSAERSRAEFKIDNVLVVPDPATSYVLSVKSDQESLKNAVLPLGKNTNVGCFVRELTQEYAGSFDLTTFLSTQKEFEKQLALIIAYVAIKMEARIHLFPMHSFYVGGDDRIINRRIAKEIGRQMGSMENQGNSAVCARLPVSPREILESMYHAKFNICMRFHAVVFAENMDVPYLAIDYTHGGKIHAFLTEKGQDWRMLTFEAVLGGQWKSKVNHIIDRSLGTVK